MGCSEFSFADAATLVKSVFLHQAECKPLSLQEECASASQTIVLVID